MFIFSGISTFLWILLAYLGAHYAAVNFDWVQADFSYIVWSDKSLYITVRDVFMMTGILFLFFEIWKAANASKFSTTETVISFFVAIAYLVIFITLDWAHNIDFFILMMMAFLDAIGGFVIEINAAHRDITISK